MTSTPNLLALLAVAGGLAFATPVAAQSYNPCGAIAARANPCSAKKANPCAANPCTAKASNPCSAKASNPCSATPCSAKANPCAATSRKAT